MKRRGSLEDPWEEMRLRQIAEEAESIEEAILKVLNAYSFSLTFNEIKRVMPERFRHPEKIRRALNRLIDDLEVVRILWLLGDDQIEAYTTFDVDPHLKELIREHRITNIFIMIQTKD